MSCPAIASGNAKNLRIRFVDVSFSIWCHNLAEPSTDFNNLSLLSGFPFSGRIVRTVDTKTKNSATVLPKGIHRGLITFRRVHLADCTNELLLSATILSMIREHTESKTQKMSHYNRAQDRRISVVRFKTTCGVNSLEASTMIRGKCSGSRRKTLQWSDKLWENDAADLATHVRMSSEVVKRVRKWS